MTTLPAARRLATGRSVRRPPAANGDRHGFLLPGTTRFDTARRDQSGACSICHGWAGRWEAEWCGHTVIGSDGSCVPIPWSADRPSLGFSTTTGWLPQPVEFAAASVAAQRADRTRPLHLDRAAVALRRQMPHTELGNCPRMGPRRSRSRATEAGRAGPTSASTTSTVHQVASSWPAADRQLVAAPCEHRLDPHSTITLRGLASSAPNASL